MTRTLLIAGAVAVVVVAVAVGAALYTGVGPGPGGDAEETIEDFPTQQATDTVGQDATETTPTAPFTFTIDDIDDCGQTCRDVTATLDNNQDEPAEDVTVYIRLYAGEDNTAADDMVWEGTEDVGTMAAGASHTTTERVELTLQEAQDIDQEDGWITILTTVESTDRTVTFTTSEQVS